MKLKKSVLVTVYLIPVALMALASTLTAVTVEAAASVGIAQYPLQNFTAISTLWLLILAGCLAIIASAPKVARLIMYVIGALSVFELVSIGSKLSTFPDWLSNSVFSAGDDASLLMAPWIVAALGLLMTVSVSILGICSSKTWTSTRKYDRSQAATANPWAAIDQGVDPTVDQ
jgi:hypothetical protein